MNRHEHYKRRSAGFENANAGRRTRASRQEELRKYNRAANVARHRAFAGNAENEAPSSQRADPDARLRKWKEEQRQKKKIEAQKKKPIFKVGIVHHKIYSPPFSDRFSKKVQLDHSKRAKRVLTKSFAPSNYAFTVPSGVIEIPMFGRIAGASPNDAGWTQIMKGRLEWQTAVVRLSQALSVPATNRNSSDFRPRACSKDESNEEANLEDESSSKVADFVNRRVAQIVDVRRATSRSGTPILSFSPSLLTNRGKNNARKEPTNSMRNRASSANEIPTTAKGIKSEKFFGNESCPAKSSRKVDIDDDVFLDEVPAAEVARELINNTADLGKAPARKCSHDSNDNFVEPYDTVRNVTVRSVKKRLDFENQSFDECENTNNDESAATWMGSTVIPHIVVTIPTPVKRQMKQTPWKHNRSNLFEV